MMCAGTFQRGRLLTVLRRLPQKVIPFWTPRTPPPPVGGMGGSLARGSAQVSVLRGLERPYVVPDWTQDSTSASPLYSLQAACFWRSFLQERAWRFVKCFLYCIGNHRVVCHFSSHSFSGLGAAPGSAQGLLLSGLRGPHVVPHAGQAPWLLSYHSGPWFVIPVNVIYYTDFVWISGTNPIRSWSTIL